MALGISSLDSIEREKLDVCLDASVAINLLATGYADKILCSKNLRFCVEEAVCSEIRLHPVDRTCAAPHLSELFYNDHISLERLRRSGEVEFLALVSGGLISALGDGEAATIALARQLRGIAAIDDQKAIRVACNRYTSPPLKIVSTLDIIGRAEFAQEFAGVLDEVLLNALQYARMRVPKRYEEWVRGRIGQDAFRKCNSIRLAARLASPSE